MKTKFLKELRRYTDKYREPKRSVDKEKKKKRGSAGEHQNLKNQFQQKIAYNIGSIT